MCDSLKRFGVSMEEALLAQLDKYVLTKGFQNRSQALRSIVKQSLLQSTEEKEIVTVSFEVPKTQLPTKLNQVLERCDYWGIVKSFTSVMVEVQTVQIIVTLEIDQHQLEHLQLDPLLQPIHIYFKGSEIDEVNI